MSGRLLFGQPIYLIVVEITPEEPIAFMGIENQRLEMLFSRSGRKRKRNWQAFNTIWDSELQNSGSDSE